MLSFPFNTLATVVREHSTLHLCVSFHRLGSHPADVARSVSPFPKNGLSKPSQGHPKKFVNSTPAFSLVGCRLAPLHAARHCLDRGSCSISSTNQRRWIVSMPTLWGSCTISLLRVNRLTRRIRLRVIVTRYCFFPPTI